MALLTSIKTKAVKFKDGREGRGVKVSERNFQEVETWVQKYYENKNYQAVALSSVNGDGDVSQQRVRLSTKKGVRVAKVGDTVVKLAKDDFVVVKAADFESQVQI